LILNLLVIQLWIALSILSYYSTTFGTTKHFISRAKSANDCMDADFFDADALAAEAASDEAGAEATAATDAVPDEPAVDDNAADESGANDGAADAVSPVEPN
jgi:hypothetical protein